LQLIILLFLMHLPLNSNIDCSDPNSCHTHTYRHVCTHTVHTRAHTYSLSLPHTHTYTHTQDENLNEVIPGQRMGSSKVRYTILPTPHTLTSFPSTLHSISQIFSSDIFHSFSFLFSFVLSVSSFYSFLFFVFIPLLISYNITSHYIISHNITLHTIP
jgi:hypothetical protein